MNDSPITIAEARTLVAAPLWPRIRAFLWDFASLCDPQRLSAAAEGSKRTPRTFEDASGVVPETPSASFKGSSAAVRPDEPSAQGTPAQSASNVREADLEQAADAAPGTNGFAALANSLAATPRVAASALRSLGLSPVFHTFPASDGSRLLLLSREDYDRLAQFLGVVALAPALRRVTLGADVRALRAALPGVYPETLAYEAYFRRYGPLFERLVPTDVAISPATVQSTGHRLLALALSSLPAPLLLRQRLRFPEGSPADVALLRLEGASGTVDKPPMAAFEGSLRLPSEGGSAAVRANKSTPAEPASNVRAADLERGHSPLETPAKLASNSELAGAASAAAILALKLSNPTEHRTLCS